MADRLTATIVGRGLLVAVAILQSACAILPDGFGIGNAGAVDDSATAAAIGHHLTVMRWLGEGNYNARGQAFEAVEAEYRALPTASNRLTRALALSVPGHPGSDVDQATAELNALMRDPVGLLNAELDLLQVTLANLERVNRLSAENSQMQSRINDPSNARRLREARSRTEALSAELARQQDENERLASELYDALRKLDAVTRIEQSTQRESRQEQ